MLDTAVPHETLVAEQTQDAERLPPVDDKEQGSKQGNETGR